MKHDRINEIAGILLLGLAVLVGVSLFSYQPDDIGFLRSHLTTEIANRAGVIGVYLGHGLVSLFGNWGGWVIPVLLLIWATQRIWGKGLQKNWIKVLGSLVLLMSAACFLSLNGEPQDRIAQGGVVGFRYSELLLEYFGPIGIYVVVPTLLILSILLTTDFLLLPLILGCSKGMRTLVLKLKSFEVSKPRIRLKTPRIKRFEPAYRPKDSQPPQKVEEVEAPPKEPPQPRPKIMREVKPKRKPEAKPGLIPVPVTSQGPSSYELPPLDLLDSPPPIEKRKVADNLDANAKILEETLGDFGIEVKVTEVTQGPVITTYELLPAPGVKVNRITNLSDDIALAMKAQSVRIVAPIPGKAAVGIEVPNSYTTLVYLREILESKEWGSSKSKLTLALGKDISGAALVTDLSQMPHLLIAGTTGSGKTVCVNSVITSLLFQFSPDEVKFLMVDPKMVELACFNGLPHLLSPVITEPKKVAGALQWVVEEMESRYSLFAKVGVRNIDFYNKKLASGAFESTEELPERLPYIIIIVDELADLMAVVQYKIENTITRLAQLSRAVGIHMIIATQRPSVDVITGVIKANFPARISFKVASKVDSRTVLDVNGADKLLGMGDMLFVRPGASKLVRAQGSLVSDGEIERVVNFAKSKGQPQYNEEILASQEKKSSMRELAKDELFDEAVKMVLETNQASVSMLQRRLGLGYTRAARIIDMMEAEGIVGSYRGSKPREILVDRVVEGGGVEE